MSLRLELTSRILDIPDIEEQKSKYSSEPAYFIGKREIAHFHSNNLIDIRLTKKLIKALNLQDKAPTSDWYEVGFKKESDLARIIILLESAVKANK